MKLLVFALTLLFLPFGNITADAQGQDGSLLDKTLNFGRDHRDCLPDTVTTNTYSKYSIHIDRRNLTLMTVPTMFYLVRDGRRDYFSESYSNVKYSKDSRITRCNIHLSTVYHRHTTLPSSENYMTPRIYDESLFEDGILSPFNSENRRFYRYRTIDMGDGTSEIVFRNRIRNTQLVRRGSAIADNQTGAIRSFVLEGEYDMIHFTLRGNMGNDSIGLFVPTDCDARLKVSFLGNRILGHFVSYYRLTKTLPDSIDNRDDVAAMDSLRPIPLSADEARIVRDYDSIRRASSSETQSDKRVGDTPKKRNWAKYIFWDIIGDNMLNRINTQLGADRKGTLRIGPVFNPLYFGYSKNKGIVYKFDVRGNYNFTDNNDITLRLRMGYSFKQRQIYFNIPIRWEFDKRRNGYVRWEFGNGNRITNSRVLEAVKEYDRNDSIDWDHMRLDYFKDMNLRVGVNYDIIAQRLALQGGASLHRRSAVDRQGFAEAGRPRVYKSFAPYLQLQYRPFTDAVPLVLTANYERGIKALGGSIGYERFEFDGQYVHDLPRLNMLQLRAGIGFYTSRGDNDYFLDYHNFHEEYIPGGWGDKWTGEFELLNSNWYNASDYYFRANATYEAPLLILSRIPWAGQVVEKERVYLSALAVNRMFPYVEMGYGFVNRVFSMGVFTGFSPQHFEGVGVKFGFELFSNY